MKHTTPSFISKLQYRWNQGCFLCVGLDASYHKLPSEFTQTPAPEAILSFNKRIIDATHDLVCAYKPNSAYYEVLGKDGWQTLWSTISYIHDNYPDIPVILDVKRGDIDSTNEAYASAIFDQFGADAATVHPYLGQESLKPLLQQKDKGVIVMGANSNRGAGEFQDLEVGVDREPLYLHVARAVAQEWNVNGNCGLTVAATEPEKIALVRKAAKDLPLLILGIGAQGGELGPSVNAAQNSHGDGMIVNSSRTVLYASNRNDFELAARNSALDSHNQIQKALNN